jgi:hypothetical protein
MYGLGDDGATVLDYPPSGIPVDVAGIGTGLTPCSQMVTAPGFVGPINCNAAGGNQVNYTPALTPPTASSPYLVYILIALGALFVVPALIGGGGRR